METAVNRQSARSDAPIDLATLACLLNTLSRLALIASIATLMIALATATDIPYADEFLDGRGSECVLSLLFLIVSSFTWALYLGTLTMEPVILPVWEQASRSIGALLTLLPRILWAVVCRVGPLGAALLIGASHPYRDPDEPTGLRRIATSDASTRFTHRWVAGTSPQILYH